MSCIRRSPIALRSVRARRSGLCACADGRPARRGQRRVRAAPRLAGGRGGVDRHPRGPRSTTGSSARPWLPLCALWRAWPPRWWRALSALLLVCSAATALAPGSPCPFLPLCVWCAQRSPPLWHRAPIACGCCFTSGVLPPRWRCAAHTREIGGANCQGLGMLPTRRGVWGREEHKRSGEADVGL